MSHSIIYDFEDLQLLTTDGRVIARVDGKALIHLTAHFSDDLEIYDMEIEIDDEDGNRAELRQQDDWHFLCRRAIELLWKNNKIDAYDGMEPEEFHAATAADFARDDRLSREAA
ncbi:hypothetical protein CHELA1G11_13032 [Hyphomicrobiales bacterium]|nr:hypothetical protein CHELA1G2_11278 [Hyphomicrobiales bacterium]CAH1668829.1 hypothetical protein CHELA1G11_13032 [Hyphomicrobiales bacterium]